MKTILIIAAVGLSAWNQYYPLNDERHVYWGATQMFGMLTIALFYISGFVRRNKLAMGLMCLALACIFYPYVAFRVISGIQRLTASYATVSRPEILRGMQMTPSDAQFYMSVSDSMSAYFRRYPEGNVLNVSGDALYAAYDPRIHNIHPLYLVWMELYTIYQDFPTKFARYAQTNKPFIVTQSEIPEGYCLVPVPPNTDNIRLAQPCQNK